MILYRIINEEEYNAIKNGTINLLEKTPANRFLGEINRVYESDGKENDNQYLYFFEDVRACENGWNGRYIIQVDIPEEELEKGYGRYASINSLFSRYITMDEYRIKKEDFTPESYILGIVDKDKIPEEWYATSEKHIEATAIAMEQVYLSLNFVRNNFERVDASGLRGDVLSNFSIPEELKEISTKINQTLYKSVENLDEIRTCEYDPTDRYSASVAFNTVQSILKRMSKVYSIEQILNLFEGDISKKRIFDIFSIMEIGAIATYDKDYYVVRNSRCHDVKLMVASILAKSDISEENYNSIRDDILNLFSEHEELLYSNDETKKEALEFIFLEGNELGSFRDKYERGEFIKEIGNFFAHYPENVKNAAQYLFIGENTTQTSDSNNNYRRNNDEKIKYYEYINKNIEEYNSNNKEKNIDFSLIIDLFKELDKIGVEFKKYNKKQKEFFKSNQIIELLTQSKDDPNYEQNLLEIFQELGAIPQEPLTRPKTLPYTDRRIAEGVANINPRDLHSTESQIKDETKD